MANIKAKTIYFIILSLLIGIFCITQQTNAQVIDPINLTGMTIAPDANSALIKWSTNLPSRGRFMFGASQNLGSWVEDNKIDLNHETTLSGLQINQKYYFQIQIFDQYNRVFTSGIFEFTSLNQDKNTPIISNIQTSYVTGNTITVIFQTNKLATGCIYIGLDRDHLNEGGCDGGNTSDHEITVRNLIPNTAYVYRAHARDNYNNVINSVFYNVQTASSNDTDIPDLSVRLTNYKPQMIDANKVNMILTLQANRPVEGRLIWGEQSKSYNHEIKFPSPRATLLNLTISDLEYYKKYYFTIEARDIFGKQTNALEQVFFTPSNNYYLTENNDSLYNLLDPAQDLDLDGLTNAQEKIYGTNPFKADTDGDGFLDGEEVEHNYNPLGSGRLASLVNSHYFAYGKLRLKSLAAERQLSLTLKSQLQVKFKGKIPVSSSDWSTLVNAYIYGNYPVDAIYQAIIHKGKTVHPYIPWSSWKNSADYQIYMA
jgi:hypothetical protein